MSAKRIETSTFPALLFSHGMPLQRLALRVFLLQFIRNTAHDPQHLLVHKNVSIHTKRGFWIGYVLGDCCTIA